MVAFLLRFVLFIGVCGFLDSRLPWPRRSAKVITGHTASPRPRNPRSSGVGGDEGNDPWRQVGLGRGETGGCAPSGPTADDSAAGARCFAD